MPKGQLGVFFKLCNFITGVCHLYDKRTYLYPLNQTQEAHTIASDEKEQPPEPMAQISSSGCEHGLPLTSGPFRMAVIIAFTI